MGQPTSYVLTNMSKFRGSHIFEMRWKQPRLDETKYVHAAEKLAKANFQIGSTYAAPSLFPNLSFRLNEATGLD